MFAMSGQPVEVLRAMMNRVEAPEKIDLVLQAMAPVNQDTSRAVMTPPALFEDDAKTDWRSFPPDKSFTPDDSLPSGVPKTGLPPPSPPKTCKCSSRPGDAREAT